MHVLYILQKDTVKKIDFKLNGRPHHCPRSIQLKKAGSAFLNHREVSVPEAAHRILSLPIKQLSRAVVFVDTNPPHERIGVFKGFTTISQLDDDQNVFHKSLMKDMNIGHIPNNMCLAEFAANYCTSHQCSDDTNDVVPDTIESDSTSGTITLLNGFGKMHKRKREAVIRFRRYNKDKEPSSYYCAHLMYYPWCDEDCDLLSDCGTYVEHYHNVKQVVDTNEAKHSVTPDYNVQYNQCFPQRVVGWRCTTLSFYCKLKI